MGITSSIPAMHGAGCAGEVPAGTVTAEPILQAHPFMVKAPQRAAFVFQSPQLSTRLRCRCRFGCRMLVWTLLLEQGCMAAHA